MKGIVKTLAIAVAVSSVVLFLGCSGDGQDGAADGFEDLIVGDGGIVQSYITGYFRPNGLSISTVNELYVKFEIEKDNFNSELTGTCREKYNDLSYYQLQSVPVFALCGGVTSLAVETVGYYDESHPAGSDISDIVYCEYLTYYEFIAGGYVPIEKDERYSSSPLFYTDYVGSLLHGMWLSEVNYGNSQLMTEEILIEFPVAPEAPGTYEFRFFFNMPDLALETTFEYEFE